MTDSDVAASLVAQFNRMVERDGGSLELLGTDGGVITVGYRLGSPAACEDGSCVLPDVELGQLMAETLRRRDSSLSVVVERIQVAT
jgi:hypothetical protein